MQMTRRDFLRTVGAATVILSLNRLGLAPLARAEQAAGASDALPPMPSYRSWEDVHRRQWTWDRVVRGTHNRSNCMSACAWDVYVKDNVVWREEQAQTYDEGGRGGAPDFFPRGCQKGGCYSKVMASPQRLRYPLERVGERGGGKWKRISWDEALDKVADGIIAAATAHGTETIIGMPGPNFDHGPDSAAEFRMLSKIGATILDTFSGIGDMPVGMTQTYGMFMNDGTIDDYFRSDFLVMWSSNPLYTRIPDAHFFTEARYRGATLVVISPDYNATSIHADLWLNPKTETDTALALAMAQVILAEKLHKPDYIREQTDLPFLVRTDNGKFLLERDVVRDGREDAFHFWDEASGAIVIAPGSQGMSKPTLVLGDVRPALEGRWKVGLADGSSVEVEPLFEQLRRQLDRSSTPELAEKDTGVGAATIRSVARRMASAKSALIYASTGACKHYHSDLMHRSFALLMALTGNQGRPGGGLRMGSWWGVSGFDELGFGGPSKLQKALIQLTGRPAVRDIEAFLTKRSSEEGSSPELPWLNVHAGYADLTDNPAYNDPANPLATGVALKTALERKWIAVYPPPGRDPKVLLVNSINPLRRWAAPQVALKNLWPKLDLIVNINVQMSTTGLHSDILLPAAAFYEKIGIKYAWGFLPYLVLNDKAVEPMDESRNEWWIWGNIARRIQERARARGVAMARDAFGGDRDLTRLFEDYSEGGTFDPADPRTGMDYIFEHSEICEGTTWDEAIKRGVIPIRRQQAYGLFNNMCSDVDFSQPLYPNSWQVDGKESWPTVTGRQQFRLEHDWYVAAGEALPVHKNPPDAGGDHPLRMTGGHTRWSIHTLWRGEKNLLRLQRGEPVVYMNADDAVARGIADNDRVRTYNDVGAFECLVKTAPSLQPGQVLIYHAWENFQFARHQGQQEPIAGPWKNLHMAGGYGQLHIRGSYAGPNFGPRGMLVDVKKV